MNLLVPCDVVYAGYYCMHTSMGTFMNNSFLPNCAFTGTCACAYMRSNRVQWKSFYKKMSYAYKIIYCGEFMHTLIYIERYSFRYAYSNVHGFLHCLCYTCNKLPFLYYSGGVFTFCLLEFCFTLSHNKRHMLIVCLMQIFYHLFVKFSLF